MKTTIKSEFEITGTNARALFSLKVHRGEGMVLLAMNWKNGQPPVDFVGFAIEYKEPGGDKFFSLKNRLSFADSKGKVSKQSTSSLLAPFQKFRWVHFPYNAYKEGDFIYKVKPVFMNPQGDLSYGESQQATLSLMRQTYPNQLNVTFTRGFVSSQAFVDQYASKGDIGTLIPAKADDGLDFTPTHPDAAKALTWMGFEAREAIYNLLKQAVEQTDAKVKVIAFDLNEPVIVGYLKQMGSRLEIIIDDSKGHGGAGSAETKAATQLIASSGGKVKRQHLGQLQHNKVIVVNGKKLKAAVCGSTNFSWRGLYVQANNAVIVYGEKAIQPFLDAFDNYWKYDSISDFGGTPSADLNKLNLDGIDAQVTFSPHARDNIQLKNIAKAIQDETQSSLFYSLAFLAKIKGELREAITSVTQNLNIFVYGIADRKVGGIDLQKPNGNVQPVYPSEISKNLPEPFKSEPTGGFGVRMHHKFVVIDFDKPTARVYLGSYNFSNTADTKNGENLLVIRDRKIAVSYMIEALRLFDHYHFRIASKESKKAKKVLQLARPPYNSTAEPWWKEYYTDHVKIRDRELFA
jgi:hypothetical protein